jgi:two-component system sensor histidine kinase GlrK
MKIFRSPTLVALIFLGFAIVILPLVTAIFTAIAQVDRFAHESRAALITVQENTTMSRALAERINLMERNARQFQVLKDVSYKAIYDINRTEAMRLLDDLTEATTDPALTTSLYKTQRAAMAVSDLVESIGAESTPDALDTALTELRNYAREVVRNQNIVSREMARTLPDNAQSLQHTLILQATLVIPLSGVLALLMLTIISRPLRQIRNTIRTLGRGSLVEQVQVRGLRDLEELGQHLEWLRLRLVELEAQKAQFLRNVSHELKTPLTNIREGADLLLENQNASGHMETGRILKIVSDNSVRLQQMIEELLRYGAEGDLTAQPESRPVQFDNLVREVIGKYESILEAHAITLTTALMQVPVNGNPARLKIIVDNLLSNAVKYTPHGGKIDIQLSLNKDAILLTVSDNGPGVPESFRPHVFEWFQTGPRPSQAVVSGTGIGLAIASEYAKQHDGVIRLLESDTGAAFQLQLGRPVDD